MEIHTSGTHLFQNHITMEMEVPSTAGQATAAIMTTNHSVPAALKITTAPLLLLILLQENQLFLQSSFLLQLIMIAVMGTPL